MIALKGQIKQVQHLSGKLDRPSGGKSDHYIKNTDLLNRIIKTKVNITQVVYENEVEK